MLRLKSCRFALLFWHQRQGQEAQQMRGVQTEWQGCRQVNHSVMALECGEDCVPARLILKSTENVCDQMRPAGFVVVVKLNVNMHTGILWRL